MKKEELFLMFALAKDIDSDKSKELMSIYNARNTIDFSTTPYTTEIGYKLYNQIRTANILAQVERWNRDDEEEIYQSEDSKNKGSSNVGKRNYIILLRNYAICEHLLKKGLENEIYVEKIREILALKETLTLNNKEKIEKEIENKTKALVKELRSKELEIKQYDEKKLDIIHSINTYVVNVQHNDDKDTITLENGQTYSLSGFSSNDKLKVLDYLGNATKIMNDSQKTNSMNIIYSIPNSILHETFISHDKTIPHIMDFVKETTKELYETVPHIGEQDIQHYLTKAKIEEKQIFMKTEDELFAYVHKDANGKLQHYVGTREEIEKERNSSKANAQKILDFSNIDTQELLFLENDTDEKEINFEHLLKNSDSEPLLIPLFKNELIKPKPLSQSHLIPFYSFVSNLEATYLDTQNMLLNKKHRPIITIQKEKLTLEMKNDGTIEQARLVVNESVEGTLELKYKNPNDEFDKTATTNSNKEKLDIVDKNIESCTRNLDKKLPLSEEIQNIENLKKYYKEKLNLLKYDTADNGLHDEHKRDKINSILNLIKERDKGLIKDKEFSKKLLILLQDKELQNELDKMKKDFHTQLRDLQTAKKNMFRRMIGDTNVSRSSKDILMILLTGGLNMFPAVIKDLYDLSLEVDTVLGRKKSLNDAIESKENEMKKIYGRIFKDLGLNESFSNLLKVQINEKNLDTTFVPADSLNRHLTNFLKEQVNVILPKDIKSADLNKTIAILEDKEMKSKINTIEYIMQELNNINPSFNEFLENSGQKNIILNELLYVQKSLLLNSTTSESEFYKNFLTNIENNRNSKINEHNRKELIAMFSSLEHETNLDDSIKQTRSYKDLEPHLRMIVNGVIPKTKLFSEENGIKTMITSLKEKYKDDLENPELKKLETTLKKISKEMEPHWKELYSCLYQIEKKLLSSGVSHNDAFYVYNQLLKDITQKDIKEYLNLNLADITNDLYQKASEMVEQREQERIKSVPTEGEEEYQSSFDYGKFVSLQNLHTSNTSIIPFSDMTLRDKINHVKDNKRFEISTLFSGMISKVKEHIENNKAISDAKSTLVELQEQIGISKNKKTPSKTKEVSQENDGSNLSANHPKRKMSNEEIHNYQQQQQGRGVSGDI